MSNPNAMPQSNNVIGAQVISSLIETKTVSWTHKSIDEDATTDPKRPVVIETKRAGTELRLPLAQNVSDLSVERAARKLLPA